MSNISEYIKQLKNKMKNEPELSELELMRYVYIDLGKRLDFDINYTFGNKKTKANIYGKDIDEEELNRIWDVHTSICKGISYLYAHILNQLGIKTNVIIDMNSGINRHATHMYNTIELRDERICIADLEADLEYIQSGAKTRKFAIDQKSGENIISEEELRNWDIKNGYIYEGYYLEDVIHYLKIAMDNNITPLDKKLEFFLQNLNVYKDNRSVKYREMTKYQERMFKEMFSKEELKKIHQINTYEQQDNCTKYISVVMLEKNGYNNDVYIFSDEEYNYRKSSMEELDKRLKNGLVEMKGIPGLKTFRKQKSKDEFEK